MQARRVFPISLLTSSPGAGRQTCLFNYQQRPDNAFDEMTLPRPPTSRLLLAAWVILSLDRCEVFEKAPRHFLLLSRVLLVVVLPCPPSVSVGLSWAGWGWAVRRGKRCRVFSFSSMCGFATVWWDRFSDPAAVASDLQSRCSQLCYCTWRHFPGNRAGNTVRPDPCPPSSTDFIIRLVCGEDLWTGRSGPILCSTRSFTSEACARHRYPATASGKLLAGGPGI